ncbi:MAG: glycosyltransferase family 2 protein [Bryobacteraceae bacterium]
MQTNSPRVSIGLPVFNGERFLPLALEGLLGQTYKDFELILCDNASTDGTEKICREFAARDERIRYYRNETNEGAAANFNKTVHLARGEYFKWSSDDDVCSANFLEECVAVLDSDRAAVLVYAKTSCIDEEGKVVGRLFRDVRAADPDPAVRLGEILSDKAKSCQGIFGLMRTEALRKTPLLQGWWASDRNILARLALAGRLVEIDSAEFFFRTHSGRSTREYPTPQAHSVWFDPKNKGRAVFPRWRLASDYVTAVREAPLPLRTKAACLWHIIWDFRWVSVLLDLAIAAREVGRPKLSQRAVPNTTRQGGS